MMLDPIYPDSSQNMHTTRTTVSDKVSSPSTDMLVNLLKDGFIRDYRIEMGTNNTTEITLHIVSAPEIRNNKQTSPADTSDIMDIIINNIKNDLNGK